MWTLDKRRIRFFADDGSEEDGAGGAGGDPTPLETSWWRDDEFTEEQLPVVKRYKTRQAWNTSHFEQRKAISAQVSPPDPANLTPEEYAAKL